MHAVATPAATPTTDATEVRVVLSTLATVSGSTFVLSLVGERLELDRAGHTETGFAPVSTMVLAHVRTSAASGDRRLHWVEESGRDGVSSPVRLVKHHHPVGRMLLGVA